MDSQSASRSFPSLSSFFESFSPPEDPESERELFEARDLPIAPSPSPAVDVDSGEVSTTTEPAVDVLYDLLHSALDNILAHKHLNVERDDTSTLTLRPPNITTTMAPTIAHMPEPSTPNITLLETIISSDENITLDSDINHIFTSPWPSVLPPPHHPPATPTFTSGLLPNTTLEYCTASPEDYDLIPSVLCSSLFVFGLVFALFGTRCARAFAFFSSSLLASVLTYLTLTYVVKHRALYSLPESEHISADSMLLAGSLLAGTVVGGVLCLVNRLAAVMVGLQLGVLSALAILSVIFLGRQFHTDNLPLFVGPQLVAVFVVISAILGLFLMLSLPKASTIVASSCYGSAMSIICVDYFLSKFALFHWFWNNFNVDNSWSQLLTPSPNSSPDSPVILSICPGSLILLCVWAGLTLFAMIVQSCCTCRRTATPFRKSTGREYVATTPSTMLLTPGSADITSGTGNREKGKSIEDLRLEQKHRKYRYIYQVRTAHGDVLSQQYFQGLHKQKKLCFPGGVGGDNTDTCTFNSDMSSHFLSESPTTTLSVA